MTALTSAVWELLVVILVLALIASGIALWFRRNPKQEDALFANVPVPLQAVRKMLDELQATLPTRADVESMIDAAKGKIQTAVAASSGGQTVPLDHVVLDPLTAAQGAAVVKAYIALVMATPPPVAPIDPRDMVLLLAALGGPNIRADAAQYTEWHAKQYARA